MWEAKVSQSTDLISVLSTRLSFRYLFYLCDYKIHELLLFFSFISFVSHFHLSSSLPLYNSRFICSFHWPFISIFLPLSDYRIYDFFHSFLLPLISVLLSLYSYMIHGLNIPFIRLPFPHFFLPTIIGFTISFTLFLCLSFPSYFFLPAIIRSKPSLLHLFRLSFSYFLLLTITEFTTSFFHFFRLSLPYFFPLR